MDWNAIFGSGENLDPLQMALRSFVMHMVAISKDHLMESVGFN